MPLCPYCEAPHGQPHKPNCAMEPLPDEPPDPDHPRQAPPPEGDWFGRPVKRNTPKP